MNQIHFVYTVDKVTGRLYNNTFSSVYKVNKTLMPYTSFHTFSMKTVGAH